MIKFNSNQRYATTAVTAAVIRDIGSKVGVPLQVNCEFLCVVKGGSKLKKGLLEMCWLGLQGEESQKP